MRKIKFTTKLVAILAVLLVLLVPTGDVFAQNTSPLCLTARNGSVTVTFYIENVTHTIQYSTDGTNWSTYTSNSQVTISANQSVYFRAATNQTTATAFGYSYWPSHFVFSSTNGGSVEGSGNIMSLYGPDCPNLPLQPRAFTAMFNNCTSLTKAPELPATTLALQCYSGMFVGCTSLIQAPDLPADTLADECYSSMFYGCTSLTQGPSVLQADSMPYFCCHSMFAECSSLISAPALPTTSLDINCYDEMFKNCSSLTTPPALPATKLAGGCYVGMFSGCTSLTTAPALPATKLANACYGSMFYGCTSLTEAPALPADTMENSCYSYMFDSCTSLRHIPLLPAYVLQESCYERMFNDCHSLIVNHQAPGKAWFIPSNAQSAVYWNLNMFAGTGGSLQFGPNVGQTYYIGSGMNVMVNSNDTTMGTVSGTGEYNCGDTVIIVAMPKAQHHLVNWSNGATNDTIILVVAGDTTFTAYFDFNHQHVITVGVNDTTMGSVTEGGTYDYGTTITLTATPNEHYHFVVWSNGDTVETINIVVSKDSTLTAFFAIDQHNVTAIPNDGTMGIVTGSGSYDYGTTATLTATPNEGFVFTAWSNGATSNTIFIQVESDTALTAMFDPIPSAVDDVEGKEYIVYSNGNNIHINGAAGELIRIYDINGKLISEVEEASDEQIVPVYVSGVYFVRINEKKSIKVVVK